MAVVVNPGGDAASGVATIDGRDHLSWTALDHLVQTLASAIGSGPELMLAVTRGGLVPAGMLAYRLGIREILVAGVVFYDETGPAAAGPQIGHFPDPTLLRGRRVLIVDEVWESGQTMAAVAERVRAAGGLPTTVVIYYKPGRSRVASVPDYYAATTDRWVVYPYKAGQ